jgi:Orsellinic acid/F9775 biosynthesis cluster protein D
VLLCRSCGTCYVRGNYGRHLVEVHRVKGMRKRAVVEGLAGTDLAASVAEVVRPPHGQTRVEGLRVHDGWSCDVDSCTTVSTSHDAIRQHCSRVHRLNVKAAGMVSRVKLQTLFREHPQYFIVTVPEVDLRSSPARQRATSQSPIPSTSPRSRRGCGGRSSISTSGASTRRPSRQPTSYPGQPAGRWRWPSSAAALTGCCGRACNGWTAGRSGGCTASTASC